MARAVWAVCLKNTGATDRLRQKETTVTNNLNPSPAKKVYEAPRLKLYGEVEKLTAAKTLGTTDLSARLNPSPFGS